MNTKITFTEWSEQIHHSIPTISQWKKRFGKDSVFPFPREVERVGLEKFYVKEELENWFAVFKANYPMRESLFVHSSDREVVVATRRLVELKPVFERTYRELKALEEFLAKKAQGEQK